MRTAALKLKYSKAQTFHVAVVSTVSSGKSTFINALIGNELLPAENQVCTSRTVAVLDNDRATDITGHILYSRGEYEKIPSCTAAQISGLLNSKESDIADVIIECSIPGVRSTQKSLMIVDTPGINNSMDVTHAEITTQYIKSMSSGLIVFIINATQMGTNDECALLGSVKQLLDKTPELNIIFVLNKVDELDMEKEPLEKVMQNCYSYLKGLGFGNVALYPVSAQAAMLFKKALANAPMTKKEMIDFTRFFEQFASPGLQLSLYAIPGTESSLDETCVVGPQRMSRRELLSSLANTGLAAVERAVEDAMLRQFDVKPLRVTGPVKKTSQGNKSPAQRISTRAFPMPKRPTMRKKKGQT